MDAAGTLADVPGLPETHVSAEVLAQLPATTPAPPWDCRVRAVLWVQRAPSPLPSGFRYAGRVRTATMGAVVDYLDSPVGPYREVFAGPLLRGTPLPVVHVPFIAVDSLPSLHGGRTHWALPKTLARFDGDVACGEVTATGDGWSVAVRARPHGPSIPLRAPLLNAQTERRTRVSLRGRGRVAQLRVSAAGAVLSGWLGTGTHVGLAVEGRLVVQGPA